jgi:hypothetical protein
MTDLSSLIERVERGERTRELEVAIYEFVLLSESKRWTTAPHYFSSLDAARSLVPKGYVVMSGASRRENFFCEIGWTTSSAVQCVANAKSETECAACVLAALHARSS